MKKKKWINDKYTYSKQLGQGGNARVFLAKNAVESKSELALKILDESPNNFHEKIERFKIETKLVLRIQDEFDGIIPIYDYHYKENEEDHYWYVMPLATSIKEYFSNHNDIIGKIECIIDISKTLSQLHALNIVHRDIKPSNIYYYNQQFALSDFGLVDYPEKDDLTRTDEQIGAKATIDPEMKRDSKNADGKLADVYSLAKTTWMLLTEEKFAFEGIYNPDSKLMGLKNYLKKNNQTLHLVELDQLLVDSTQDAPYLRPSMLDFSKRLSEWFRISQDFKKSNLSQWSFIQKRLFNEAIPKSAYWENIDDIVRVLNLLGDMPNLNHMFIPSGGGADLNFVERANEKDCLLMKAGGSNYVIKPKLFSAENVDKDFIWSYFRLELEGLEPVISGNELNREFLTEDVPGHYLSWKRGNYGYYENGKKLPDNYKMVDRFLNGSFVFFSKASVYNSISGTYDARHNKMSSSEFRKDIEKMKEDYNSIDYTTFMEKYNKNPFDTRNTEEEEIKQKTLVNEHIKFEKYIEKNYKNWCFKSICEKYEGDLNGKVVFSLKFILNGDILSPLRYVSKSGKIFEEKEIDLFVPYTTNNRFVFGDFDEVHHALKEINKYIKTLCEKDGIEWDDLMYSFSIDLHKMQHPNHLFTKSEIEVTLKAGDDSKNNVLVIDADGYAHLVENKEYQKSQYAVTHESYNAYNNYVGKYSTLNHLDDEYISSLQGWLRYLKTGRSVYVDYVDIENNDEDKLIKQIKEFY